MSQSSVTGFPIPQPYPHVPIDEQLRRISLADKGTPRKHVHILGAGMAGLTAAHVLYRLGHRVSIYEASGRVGGRVFTHRFGSEPDAPYGELGAMRIPASHDYTLHFLNELKLPLRPFITMFENTQGFVDMRGQVARMSEIQERVTPHYRLSDWERQQVSGASIFGQYLNALCTRFSPSEIKGMFDGDLVSRSLQQLDSVSLGEFVRTHSIGPDAMEYQGSFTALSGWWDMSVGMFLRDTIVDTSTGLQEIVGGMDLLPRGLAKLLPEGSIHLHKQVVRIRNQGDSVEFSLRSRNGQEETIQSEYVLCTIPFSVLRRMELSGFPPEKLRAISGMTYAAASKVLFNCVDRFWQTRYGIYGGGSVSDRISRWTFYPSDSAQVSMDEHLEQTRASHGYRLPAGMAPGLRRQFSGHDSKRRGGVLLASYSLGTDSLRQSALDVEQRVEVVKQSVGRFHPEVLERGVVTDHAVMDWNTYEWSAGAFAFLRPYELGDLHPAAIAPNGRVFFAGEHCSTDQAWIQGALIASMRSVLDIVRTP